MHYIYLHRNKNNNKVYIGQTNSEPERRWRHGEGYRKCPLFWKAVEKYGWENFEHEIIDIVDTAWREQRIANLMGDKNPNSKAVVNIETGRIFTTIKEACEWIGLNSVSGIGQCCKGQRKSCGRHPETNEPLYWCYYKGGDAK